MLHVHTRARACTHAHIRACTHVCLHADVDADADACGCRMHFNVDADAGADADVDAYVLTRAGASVCGQVDPRRVMCAHARACVYTHTRARVCVT